MADVQNEPSNNIQGGWVRTLRIAAIAQIILIVLVMVLTSQVIPPLIVFAVALAVGIGLLGTKQKPGVIVVLVVSVLHLASSFAFVAESLVHPESAGDFTTSWLSVIAAIVAIICSIAILRGASEPGSRRVGRGALVLSGVLIAVGLVAFFMQEDVEPEPGDVLVAAEDIEFAPEKVSAEAGEVSVHVDNKDTFRHTFTIPDLDVSLELPASKGSRVTFDAAAGEYEFACSVPGHEDMKGTLTVE